jgi:hypothetical protein
MVQGDLVAIDRGVAAGDQIIVGNLQRIAAGATDADDPRLRMTDHLASTSVTYYSHRVLMATRNM